MNDNPRSMEEHTTESATEEVFDKVTDTVTDKVTDKVSDKVFDKVFDKVTDTVTDKVFDEVFGKGDGLGAFQSALVNWFRVGGRDYPWRRTSDPYPILVSEAMLQQTRIATVLDRGYFSRWMREFPNWRALAAASEEEVLKAWEGLGYYNRARNLQKTAAIVCRDYDGKFPEDLEAIMALPGVGRYTAGAVMSFAFNRKAAIVDGNVSRVLSRVFAFSDPVDTPQGIGTIWALAERLVPDVDVRLFNSALMELGQRHCGRSSPDCAACPVRSWCLAEQRGVAAQLPVKQKKKTVTLREERVLLAVRNGRILLSPETGTRRKGLWRLPEIPPEMSSDLIEVLSFPYSITRYRVTLRVFASSSPQAASGMEKIGTRWVAPGASGELPPMGSPYRKALRLYFDRP